MLLRVRGRSMRIRRAWLLGERRGGWYVLVLVGEREIEAMLGGRMG